MGVKARIAAGSLVLASAGLLAFLGTWEPDPKNPGRVYPDQLAGGLPTVCNGITKHTSPYPVIVGDYWSPERCEYVERLVVSGQQLKLADCITNPNISQNTFDALSSHAHNFGVPRTCASRALGLINFRRIAEGCNALAHGPDGKPVWSYVTQPDGSKKFVQGLYSRRLAERKLCITPDS